MRTQHHMRIDVRSVLRNWNPRDWRGCVAEEGTGRVLSTDEVHDGFLDALAAGKRYLPFGKPCEGWTPEEGCPGHSLPDDDAPEVHVPRAGGSSE